MLLEADEIVVDLDDWTWALAGNEDAKKRLKEQVNGLTLYVHAFSGEGKVVTIRDLAALGIIESVSVTSGD